MYYNKVEICGVNTAKLKTLNDEEKHDLLIRSKNGDEKARQKLIDGNLRLVLSIIQRFTNRRENLDDLFQVGCIGLINCNEPTIEQIAKLLGEEPEAVTNAIEAIVEPMSLYDPVYNDGGDSIYVMDQLSDTNNTDESWLEDIALREALKTLNERERAIINMRFYKGKTQIEIASEIGISQAQVSRLEKGALERIRKQM